MSAPSDDRTAAEWGAALRGGEVSSRELVELCQARVGALDGLFRSVRALDPTAGEQAAESDRRRAAGAPLGPLDGIPVLVKDNIDVAGMPTTGGALALADHRPGADAHLIGRLRRAGLVVLGKTNLSELANFLTDDMPSGYSSVGGQVLNPYDLALTPSGSSSGSAVAAALGLAPLAVGTETDGSITYPAAYQSLVGVKPTMGLVSRHGVLPIAPSQDTAGPMAPTVAGAAALLAAMAGPDPADPATAAMPSAATPLPGPDALVADLAGVRLGVVGVGTETDVSDGAVYEAALDSLRRAGAVLSDVTVPAARFDDELTVLIHEFEPAVDAYLQRPGSVGTVGSLRRLHDWNLAHRDECLKFGQIRVDKALAVDHAAAADDYRAARARDQAFVTAALDDALAGGLDALVFPGHDGASWTARAGWPSVSVPAGYSARSRRPTAVMFVARPWSDARLLGLAAAFEAAHPARRPPAEINPAVFRHLRR